MNSNKPAAPNVPVDVTFTDSVYTSRSLFVACREGLRELKVADHRVTVKDDDAEALAFLGNHSDLQRLDD